MIKLDSNGYVPFQTVLQTPIMTKLGAQEEDLVQIDKVFSLAIQYLTYKNTLETQNKYNFLKHLNTIHNWKINTLLLNSPT